MYFSVDEEKLRVQASSLANTDVLESQSVEALLLFEILNKLDEIKGCIVEGNKVVEKADEIKECIVDVKKAVERVPESF